MKHVVPAPQLLLYDGISLTYKDLPIIFRYWSDIDIPRFSRIIDDPNLNLLISLLDTRQDKAYEHSLIPS